MLFSATSRARRWTSSRWSSVCLSVLNASDSVENFSYTFNITFHTLPSSASIPGLQYKLNIRSAHFYSSVNCKQNNGAVNIDENINWSHVGKGLIWGVSGADGMTSPVTRGVGAGGRPPVRRQNGQKVRLVSQVKESIRACNKSKIISSHSVFTFLLPKSRILLTAVKFEIWTES